MIKYILLIISFTLLGAVGSYCFKKAVSEVPTVKRIVLHPLLYFGGAFYFLSAILNIIALKYLPYTLVLPMTAITYIWTLIIAKYFLKEKVTKFKLTGIILIIIGVVLISFTTRY